MGATGQALHNQQLIYGVNTTLLLLCFLTFFARLWARKLMKQKIGADDWTMVAVLVSCVGVSTSQYLSITFGLGQHRKNITSEMFTHFMQNLYFYMLLWLFSTTVVKVSILCFYWRIFTVQSFRKTIKWYGAGLLLTSFAFLFAYIFQCHPISFFWDKEQEGTCFHQVVFYVISGSVNVVLDVIVLLLPLPLLWKLNTSTGRKVALSLLFLLGGFVCITSIFRIISLNSIDPLDFTWTNIEGGLWSLIEVEVGCICANLPHLRPIFIAIMPGRSLSSLQRSTGYNGNGYLSNSKNGEGFSRIEASRPAPGGARRQSSSDDTDYELSKGSIPGITVQTKLAQSYEVRPSDTPDKNNSMQTTVVSGPPRY